MYRITHVYVGLITGLFIGGEGIQAVLNGLFGGLGGFFPDFDLKLTHRKTLHNFVVPAIILLLFILLIHYFEKTVLWRVNILTCAISFASGWVSHVAIDSLTIRGVYPFYPFIKGFRLRIAKFRSQSLLINMFIILIASLMLGYWLYEKNIYGEIEKFVRLATRVKR